MAFFSFLVPSSCSYIEESFKKSLKIDKWKSKNTCMISDGQMATTATAAATTAAATATTTTTKTTATAAKTAVLKMEEVIERVGEVGAFSPKLGEILTFLLAETRNIRQEDDDLYIFQRRQQMSSLS
jgi:hypothetical protein